MAKKEGLLLYLPVLLSAVLYIFMGYFVERHESALLIGSYFALFISYIWLIYKSKKCSLPHLILAGIFFRLLLLLAFPGLSDDIYRFVWDGRLLMEGISPFNNLPSTIIMSADLPKGITPELYTQLNSPNYFTIYPPFAQLIFWLSTAFSPQSVLGSAVIMRMAIILAEVGTIYFLLKLCDFYKIQRKQVLWYALNPLVILELTGNLHYEAFMIFFLLAGIYFLLKNKIVISSALWALAVASKLIPLILLPVFLRRLETKKLITFYVLTAILILVTFMPLLNNALIEGLTSSISLYFQKFEFNASIYYIIRAIGYQVKGYNIIGEVGTVLALITFIGIIGFSILTKRIKLPVVILFVLLIYYLLATTVHPWYLTTLLAFTVLTPYRFAVLWSALIFLTYMGYSVEGYQEKLWLVAIEYIFVIVYMIYEIFKTRKEKQVYQCA